MSVAAPPDASLLRWGLYHQKLKIADRASFAAVPYAPNAVQQRFNDRIVAQALERKPIRLIVLKSRRMGISTHVQARFTHAACTKTTFHGITGAHLDESSTYLHGMTEKMVDGLPAQIRPAKKVGIQGKRIEFQHGSTLRTFTAGGGDGVGRATGANALHASELAFWRDQKGTLTALMQIVPDEFGTMIVLESTANGIGDEFHARCQDAQNGVGDYEFFFAPWFEFPDYRLDDDRTASVLGKAPNWDARELSLISRGVVAEQLAWRRWAVLNLCGGDAASFDQEYPDCVWAGERIGTSSGLLRLEDSEQALHLTCGSKFSAYSKGVKPTVIVTFASGRTLRCTPDHRVKTTDGFIEAHEAVDRDAIVRPPRLADEPAVHSWNVTPIERREIRMTPELALWLGMFMGDGSISNAAVSFVADRRDQDVLDVWDGLSRDLFGVEPYRRVVGSKDGGEESRFNSVRVAEILDALGCTRLGAKDNVRKRLVCVPEIIFHSTREHVADFLRGLYDCDGFVHNGRRVVFFAKGEQFARDVQLLTLACGVMSDLRIVEKKRRDVVYTGRELHVSGQRAAAFHREVGWVSERKASKTAWKVSNLGAPPKDNELVDRIVSVESAGDADVWDVTVRGGEPEFDAGGIVVHNCPEVAFLTSGRPYFPHELLESFTPVDAGRVGAIEGDPIRGGSSLRFEANAAGPLRIWQVPKPGREYVIFGDVAGKVTSDTHDARPVGAKGDYCAASVVDRETGEQVASYHAHIDPDLYGYELAKIGWLYQSHGSAALLAVENTGGYGTATIATLYRQLSYPNLYVQRQLDTQSGKWSETIGWDTSTSTRPVMLATLRSMLRDQPSFLKDEGLKREMRTFVVHRDGKPAAQSGAHDDRVMSHAGALEVWREVAQRPLRVNTTKKTSRVQGAGSVRDRAPRITA